MTDTDGFGMRKTDDNAKTKALKMNNARFHMGEAADKGDWGKREAIRKTLSKHQK